MKLAVRRTSAAFAAVATAGVSSLFLGAAPASAATETCGDIGTLIAPGICELVFTDDGVFNRTPEMTKLEVLLVGAGGAGVASAFTGGEFPTNGYAAGGGGGEVRVVDFSTATDPVAVTVSVPGAAGAVVSGALNETVDYGFDGTGGSVGSGNGGTSGTGQLGGSFLTASTAPYGAGGGAGAAASGANGGTGIVVSTLVASGSLFASDTTCYGGGGGVGVANIPATLPVQGTADCGGGYAQDLTGLSLAAATPNSGGGGGAVNSEQSEELLAGASGLVAIRWNSTIVPELAATGSETNTVALGIGIAGLVAGAGLAAVAAFSRKRKES